MSCRTIGDYEGTVVPKLRQLLVLVCVFSGLWPLVLFKTFMEFSGVAFWRVLMKRVLSNWVGIGTVCMQLAI